MESLESTKICQEIAAPQLLLLSDLEVFDALESTNSYLLEKARLGAASGRVCFAEQQTKGRGRLGRAWYSPYGGNLYCSILWRFPAQIDLSGLSLAVGVMVVRALRYYGISHPLQLKWPNDILVSQRKLAGILLERVDSAVVIGIGLNLDVRQAGQKNWIDLAELLVQPPARNRLAGILVNHLLMFLSIFREQGLAPFLAEWQQYDMLFNKTVVLSTPTTRVMGRARGVNQRGELLLEDEKGQLQRFCYGEVSVRLE